jgi:hypothetical protein
MKTMLCWKYTFAPLTFCRDSLEIKQRSHEARSARRLCRRHRPPHRRRRDDPRAHWATP